MISSMLKKAQINFIHSTKSLVPPLHKFTIQNSLNYFPFCRKLNLLNITVYWLTCQYCGRVEKKIVLSETRIVFCGLFLVRGKKVCYERKVQGELLGCCFHCTMDWPCHMFLLQVLGWWRYGTECQCYNETNIPLS